MPRMVDIDADGKNDVRSITLRAANKKDTRVPILRRPITKLQSRSKLMKQSQEIKQNWTGRETLISVFAQFLTTSTKIFFLEGRLGTRLFLHPTLSFFHNFRIFHVPLYLW